VSPLNTSEEHAIDSLYEEAPCGLVLTDGDGLFLKANSTFLKWFGYGRPDLVGRRRFPELLSVGGKIFYQTHIGPLLEMQGSVAEVKLDLRHSDGRTLPILANILDRPGEHGKIRQIAVFMAKDRVKYEREIVLARERAEDLHGQLNRARMLAEDRALFAEQMVAIVSHDLRNPLMAILLGIDAVQLDIVTPRQQRLLAQMREAGHRASRLINDLLDFTQARVGQGIRVHPVPMDVHACTSEALGELRLALPERQFVHVEKGPAHHVADADRISQLIGNLVANANAYGDPSLPITVSSIGKWNGFELSVHNHGPPIPEHLLDKLFEPMTRGEQASEGIGLGLFIVSQIARAHGGGMEVESTSSGGTCFRGYFAADVAETL
jgi:sigma-B regulation protein RsbU (phosphoserine phosphatase)